MHALVFADRAGTELAPLNQAFCPALLPIAGKPLLEHTLECLIRNGVTDLFLVVGPHSQALRQHFETGARWSLKIHYLLSRPGEAPEQVRQRLGNRLKPPYLAMRGDVLRGCRVWTAPSPAEVNGIVWTNRRGRSIGVMRVLKEPCSLEGVAWPLVKPGLPLHSLSVRTLTFSALTSLGDYHRRALEATASARQLAPAGQARGVNLRGGKQSALHHRSLAEGAALIGDFSCIHRDARLQGRVAIGSDCLVDRGARVQDSVVLDNTYIGAGLEVKNAIVWGNRMLRVDMNADVCIPERFLLADNRPAPATGLPGRLLALAALPLSLPLWVPAALLSLVRSPRQPLIRKRLYGNRLCSSPLGLQRQRFTAWRWNTPFAVLNALPLLWPVVCGHLRLIGRPADDLAQSMADTDRPWADVYHALPRGLISPARLGRHRSAHNHTQELMELEWFASDKERKRSGWWRSLLSAQPASSNAA